MPIPRRRGAACGLMLIALGVWGGLIPFVGPMFGYAIGPDDAWNWTEPRLWLEVLPAAAVVLGGVLLAGATSRGRAAFGATLAVAGGLWFLAGPTVSMAWNDGVVDIGPAHGSTAVQVLAWLGFFYGVGALIVLVGAWALGRLSVVSVADTELAHERVTGTPSAAATPARTGDVTVRRHRWRDRLLRRPVHH
jgi:hypothetical protein